MCVLNSSRIWRDCLGAIWRSSSWSRVVFAILTGLLVEEGCFIRQWHFGVQILWNKNNSFSHKSCVFFCHQRHEHPLLPWPWCTQSAFGDQFNILSDLILFFFLLCQGLISFRGNLNISHPSVSFHLLNCLSVIGGKRASEIIWPSPLLFLFSPLILLISFGLPALSLSY